VSSDPALRDPLEAGLAALGLGFAPAQVDALLDYVALLVRWNAVYNLTAVRDPREMVVRHLLDSLAIAPHVQGMSLADLGSGAGLPGIPLAIADRTRRVCLVESNGKKARFLREAARRLGLERVVVLQARAESAPVPEPFEAVTARALAALPELARLAGRWLAPGGALHAMKGPDHRDELAALPAGWSVAATHRLAIPGLDADRWLVVLRPSPTGATPASP
jgi:16S rRNA (guanine527-N7)-methyltransferase